MGGSESKPSNLSNKQKNQLLNLAGYIYSHRIYLINNNVIDNDDIEKLNKYKNEENFDELNKIINNIFNETYEKIGENGIKTISNPPESHAPSDYLTPEMLMGKKMYMGKKGGVFYFNKYGNKVYVK
jgi:hypothetical protein